jgi:hypothetical protein
MNDAIDIKIETKVDATFLDEIANFGNFRDGGK